MHLAVLVGVAALLFIHPELFRGSMFHGAGVLASLFVVGNPFVLVVGFMPSYMPQVANVHIQAFEADAGGENTVGFVELNYSLTLRFMLIFHKGNIFSYQKIYYKPYRFIKKLFASSKFHERLCTYKVV